MPLKEMGTGQVVRKEIQRAFNFVWKAAFSPMLVECEVPSLLCACHHHPSPGLSSSRDTETSHLLNESSLRPSPLALATTIPPSVSASLTRLGTHVSEAIQRLSLGDSYFTEHHVPRLIYVVACVRISFLLKTE